MDTAPIPILVVDDEEPIRNALMRFLTKQEFLVHTASSGEEALDQLRAHDDVALMVCDIRMAGMSDVDIVPRALELSPDLAIAAAMGLRDDEIEQVRLAGRLHERAHHERPLAHRMPVLTRD
ncbi:MAG TPA: response regulator [Gaiellales bacterium]|nr:response regulator [Gaiellales bacterium]